MGVGTFGAMESPTGGKFMTSPITRDLRDLCQVKHQMTKKTSQSLTFLFRVSLITNIF